MGKSVSLVGPACHLGGLSSGGLGWTDTGNKAAIGGLTREFHQRVYDRYERHESWRWQEREEYGRPGAADLGGRRLDDRVRGQLQPPMRCAGRPRVSA